MQIVIPEQFVNSEESFNAALKNRLFAYKRLKNYREMARWEINNHKRSYSTFMIC